MEDVGESVAFAVFGHVEFGNRAAEFDGSRFELGGGFVQFLTQCGLHPLAFSDVLEDGCEETLERAVGGDEIPAVEAFGIVFESERPAFECDLAVGCDPVGGVIGDAGQDFRDAAADDGLSFEARKALEGVVDFEEDVVNGFAVFVGDDLVVGKAVDHVGEEGTIAGFGFFKITEKELERIAEACVDDSAVDTAERCELKDVTEEVREVKDADVEGEEELGGDGQDDGGDDPFEDGGVEFGSACEDCRYGGEEDEADDVFGDTFEQCEACALDEAGGKISQIRIEARRREVTIAPAARRPCALTRRLGMATATSNATLSIDLAAIHNCVAALASASGRTPMPA